MKNVSTLFIALSLVTLAGCPGDDGGSDGTETATPTTMTGATGTAGDDDGMPTTAGDDDGMPTTAGDDDGVDTTAGGDDGGGMVCQHTCAADGDCTIGGADVGLTCQDGTCAGEAADTCTDDAACVAVLSGWGAIPCTMGGGECEAAMQICVDLGDGTGGCATPPSEFFMCETVAGWAEVTATNLDDGSDATVCGNPNAACHDDGYCFSPCTDDTTCNGLTCDTATGECGCADDAQCDAILAGSTCQDSLCILNCASDDECENLFDGGTVACG